MSSVALLFSSLVLVLVGLGWALFRLIAHLRQKESRYRWFELVTCLAMISWGFFILFRVPRSEWSPWWAGLAGVSILGGASNLAIVLRDRFGKPKILRCSFCNRSQRDVKKLIAGPRVHICDACVAICVAILNEPRSPEDPASEPAGPPIPEPSQ